MRRTMYLLVFMGTTLALAAALAAGVALAQSSSGAETSRDSTEFILIAEDCAGETILVTGKFNSVFHVHEDAAGGLHVNTHFNFANTTGTGEITGVKYRIPTEINSIQHLVSGEPPILISTDVSISRVIGQGRVPDQQATAVVHFVVAPEGTVKSEVVHFRFECHE